MSIAVMIVCLVLSAAALSYALLPVIAGAVRKRTILKPVEYYAPRGASPIDVMLMYYGKFSDGHELFNPLVLYWAQRGFITIKEDCRRGLILTKLKDIEPPAESDGFNPATFEIERDLFNKIFEKGDTFYTLAATHAYKTQFESFVSSVEGKASRVCKNPKAWWHSLLTVLASTVMFGLISIIAGIAEKNPVFVAMLFPVIGLAALGSAFKEIPAGTPQKYLMIPFFSLWSGMPFIAVLLNSSERGKVVLCVAAAVCMLINFVLADRDDRRSREQLENYARVCGFKNFLVLAEAEKIEALVEDDPQYFYEVLPYCYILKITQKLKAKFDRINLDGPVWYLGEMRDTLMF